MFRSSCRTQCISEGIRFTKPSQPQPLQLCSTPHKVHDPIQDLLDRRFFTRLNTDGSIEFTRNMRNQQPGCSYVSSYRESSPCRYPNHCVKPCCYVSRGHDRVSCDWETLSHTNNDLCPPKSSVPDKNQNCNKAAAAGYTLLGTVRPRKPPVHVSQLYFSHFYNDSVSKDM